MNLDWIDENWACSWCGKTVEVAHVTFADKTTAALCWADLRKMAKLKLPAKAAEAKPNLFPIQAG